MSYNTDPKIDALIKSLPEMVRHASLDDVMTMDLPEHHLEAYATAWNDSVYRFTELVVENGTLRQIIPA